MSPIDHVCADPGGCERCSRVPVIAQGAGRVLLLVPVRHMRARVTSALDACGEPWSTEGDDRSGGRLYAVATSDVEACARALLPRLSGEELVVIRATFEPAGTRASPADYVASRPVGTLLERTRQRWLGELLDERRLLTHFQPRRGPALPARPGRATRGDHRRVASRNPRGCVHQLFTGRHLRPGVLPPQYDRRHWGGRSQARADRLRGDETEKVPASTAHLLNILDQYRGAGFRVALDDVGSGYSSLVLIGDIRPDFVKLDKELTSDAVSDPFRAVIAEKLIEAARRTGMGVVAEGIATAAAAQWFSSRGVQYLQGYYFARPAAIPPREFALRVG